MPSRKKCIALKKDRRFQKRKILTKKNPRASASNGQTLIPRIQVTHVNSETIRSSFGEKAVMPNQNSLYDEEQADVVSIDQVSTDLESTDVESEFASTELASTVIEEGATEGPASASSKAVSMLTSQVTSLSSEIRNLRKEMIELQKAKTSDVRNFTPFEGANMIGIQCCRVGQPARTFVTEEENSQLREDIKELREKISKAELSKAKSSADKQNYKAELLRDIRRFKKGCEHVEQLLEIERKRHQKKKNDIEATYPLSAYEEAKRYKQQIEEYKEKLEKLKSQNPKPKPDPYKSPLHLSMHFNHKASIEDYKERLKPLKKEILILKKVIYHSEETMWIQKRSISISNAICEALLEARLEIKRRNIRPSGKEENNKYENDMKELLKSVAEKAEKDYEKRYPWKPKYLLSSETQAEGSRVSNGSEPGCSTFPTLPKIRHGFPEACRPSNFAYDTDTYKLTEAQFWT